MVMTDDPPPTYFLCRFFLFSQFVCKLKCYKNSVVKLKTFSISLIIFNAILLGKKGLIYFICIWDFDINVIIVIYYMLPLIWVLFRQCCQEEESAYLFLKSFWLQFPFLAAFDRYCLSKFSWSSAIIWP